MNGTDRSQRMPAEKRRTEPVHATLRMSLVRARQTIAVRMVAQAVEEEEEVVEPFETAAAEVEGWAWGERQTADAAVLMLMLLELLEGAADNKKNDRPSMFAYWVSEAETMMTYGPCSTGEEGHSSSDADCNQTNTCKASAAGAQEADAAMVKTTCSTAGLAWLVTKVHGDMATAKPAGN